MQPEPMTLLEGINPMQIGMIGLGRMGANMVRRLIKSGHECVVFDMSAKSVQELVCESAVGTSDLRDMIEKLATPRAVWLMVPAAAVDQTVDDLVAVARSRRHDHRWRQFLLRRRHAASEGTRDEGSPLRRCGNKRWGVGPRARLLHDDRRGKRNHRTARPDFPNARTRRGRHYANTGSRSYRRNRRDGISALRSKRRWPFRQDGAQRNRIWPDGCVCGGVRNPARGERRNTAANDRRGNDAVARLRSAISTSSICAM